MKTLGDNGRYDMTDLWGVPLHTGTLEETIAACIS